MAFRQLIAKLSPKGWGVVGAATVGAILFLYILHHVASKPSYTTIATGVAPAQTGKMTAALDTGGIPYELQNNGTAIAVLSADTAQARVALASAGVSGQGSQVDFSLFDKQSLGASNFQQQITYQRALQGQLAETIDNVQGVTGAQVELVLPNPQDELFTQSSDAASAAVLLSGGENLDSGSVRGIAQLVSSSVPGLSLKKVTITDDTGALLWPSSDGSAGDGVLSKQSAEDHYNEEMSAQVDAMLAQTLGPGKAMVQINSDLNANQVHQDSLTYTGKVVSLSKHSEVENLVNSGATGSAGATTATTTIPSYAQTATGGASQYTHKIGDSTYGADKTVTTSIIAPGAVNRQSVSLLVDSSVPKASLGALKAAVSNAVGLVKSRGDSISVGQMKFAASGQTAVTATPASGGIMAKAKYGLLGLATLMFLFFVTRMLRKRERESLGQPTWLRELQEPRSLIELEEEVGDEPTRVKRLRSPVNAAKAQIEDLVDREPERVAAQVRQWMADD